MPNYKLILPESTTAKMVNKFSICTDLRLVRAKIKKGEQKLLREKEQKWYCPPQVKYGLLLKTRKHMLGKKVQILKDCKILRNMISAVMT